MESAIILRISRITKATRIVEGPDGITAGGADAGEKENRIRFAAGLKRWEREFRKSAAADKHSLLREHLRKQKLPDEPELLLEGTILALRACHAYASIDGISTADLIRMQYYDPAKAVNAQYAFTLCFYDKAFARILVGKDFCPYGLDLADLYNQPWNAYKRCGFQTVRISRIDGKLLSKAEIARIEKHVTYDLRYDYSEDQLEFWFEDRAVEGTLIVWLHDR